jgi:hypothetical protein
VAQRANATGGGDRAVRRASVPARSPAQVADDLATALEPSPTSLVIAFVSSELDPSAVAAALHTRMAPAQVVGCTSLGEIAGPVATRTAVAVALDGQRIKFGAGLAADLSRGPIQAGRAAVSAAANAMGLVADQLVPSRHVAITLVDGRPRRASASWAARPRTVEISPAATLRRTTPGRAPSSTMAWRIATPGSSWCSRREAPSR